MGEELRLPHFDNSVTYEGVTVVDARARFRDKIRKDTEIVLGKKAAHLLKQGTEVLELMDTTHDPIFIRDAVIELKDVLKTFTLTIGPLSPDAYTQVFRYLETASEFAQVAIVMQEQKKDFTQSLKSACDSSWEAIVTLYDAMKQSVQALMDSPSAT